MKPLLVSILTFLVVGVLACGPVAQPAPPDISLPNPPTDARATQPDLIAGTGPLPQEEDPTPTPTPTPLPAPTECLKREKPDGTIEELCTVADPEPIPDSAKLDGAMQGAIAEYVSQQQARSDTPGGASSDEDFPYFNALIYPNYEVEDAEANIVAWLRSKGYDPIVGDGTIGLYINDPLILVELSQREDVSQISDPPQPKPSVD